MITALLWLFTASASDPAAVLARVDATASWRALRQAEGPPAIPRDSWSAAATRGPQTGLVSVPGHAAKKAWGAAVVDVPIARYWAAVNDDASHTRYTRLESSELLSGSPCRSGRSVLQFLPLPIVSDRWWITHITQNSRIQTESGGAMREIVWRSTVDPSIVTTASGQATIANGVPLGFTKGSWLLQSLDADTTLVEYYVWSDPGGSVPAGAASSFAAGSVVDTIEGMARLATEGPGCPIQ
jgi:hypothetical protein